MSEESKTTNFKDLELYLKEAQSDNCDDESTAKKSKPSGVRGRRGFSKKKSFDQEINHEISESSAVYTSRVTKCFNDLNAHKIDTHIMRHAYTDNNDIEEEDFFSMRKTTNYDKNKNQKKTQTEGLQQEDILELSDEENIPQTTVETTPDRDPSKISRSPTPPPEPAELRQLPRKNKRMKRNVKKAMASLTQSLSAAESQLNESFSTHTPDRDVYVIDDDEDDLTVRVDILGKIHRFIVKNEEPFSLLVAKIATKEKEEIRNVMLVHNDRTIRPNDCPKSIGLCTVDIVTCHIRSNCNDSFNDSSSFDTEEANLIEIVIQSRESRQKEIIKARIDKPLMAVMIQYSCRMKKDLSGMKFWFDGEIVTGNSVPSALDMEDGDILDMQLL